MVWWGVLLIGIGALLVGAIVGFFVSRPYLKTPNRKSSSY